MKTSTRTVLISLVALISTSAARAADAPAPATSATPPAAAKAATPVAPSGGNNPAPAAATELAVGAAAPAIKAINQEGKTVDLADAYKTGYVLVYFYPKAFTGGCTAQACSLRDGFEDLAKEKLVIFGVSHDSVEDQKRFKDTYKLPFDLIADPKGDVYKAFGVPGLRNREAFLIKDGKIIWSDTTASTTQQADDVKKALAEDRAPAAKPAVPAAPAAK